MDHINHINLVNHINGVGNTLKPPMIQCRDVGYSYDGQAALTGVTFDTHEGDALCIVGENGSGKSTLISLLLGLKSPQQGSIVYGNGIKPKQVGYLPQQSAAQKDFPASINEVVISGRLSTRGARPFYTKEDRSIAAKHMERLSISHLARRCYRELSGGQQQRVLLARALCATGSLLLLDEPVAGLDPLATSELYQLIDSIRKDDGVTIIMVSHDIHSAMRHATHVLHLSTKMLFSGAVGDYLASPIGSRFVSAHDKGRNAALTLSAGIENDYQPQGGDTHDQDAV